jgi:hypothetical protein
MTSIEWLFKQLWEEPKDKFTWYVILTKAKEMEKEQIIDAFWNGDNSDCTSEQNTKEFAEQYYNETFKKD